MPDLNAGNLEAAMKIIAGSARSMGVTIEMPLTPVSSLLVLS